MPIQDAHPPLAYDTAFDDPRRYYTMKEALEVLPDEDRKSSNGLRLDSSTGRITRSRRQGKATIERDDDEHRGSEDDSLETCFYGPKRSASTKASEKGLAKPTAKNLVTKLFNPITRFRFGSKEPSASASEQVQACNINCPFDPRPLRVRTAESQYIAQLNESNELDLLHSQGKNAERHVSHSRPTILRRLSITRSFGPALAECIEHAISYLSQQAFPHHNHR